MLYGFSGPQFASTEMMRSRTSSWCPYDRRRLQVTSSVSTVFYLSCMKSPAVGKDHRQCSDEYCGAYTIDPSTYETKHTQWCDKIDCPNVIAAEEDLIRALQNEKLPLTQLEVNASDISLKAVEWEDDMQFDALSHVWSDGLGNEKENSLPRCQLIEIVEVLRSKSTESIGESRDAALYWGKQPTSYKNRAKEFDKIVAKLQRNHWKLPCLGLRKCQAGPMLTGWVTQDPIPRS